MQQTNAYPRTYKYYYGRTDSNGLPIIEKIGVSNEPRDAAVFHDNNGAPVMLQSTNDVTCLYVFDGTGNPVAISTSYQTTAVALRYDPYGAENRLDSGGDNGGWVDSPYTFGTGIKDRQRRSQIRPTLVRPQRRQLDPTRHPQRTPRPQERQPLRLRRRRPHQQPRSHRT